MALIKFNFLSDALAMQTNVTVILPTQTFADKMAGKDPYVPGVKYQVLWLLHGAFGDDSDYVNFSNILRYAEENKLAVVMPSGYNSGYADAQGNLAAKYYSFIVDELPKVLGAYFPLSDKREDNFVGGLSMGGMGAFKCAMMRPEQYSAALLMSGAGRDPSIPSPFDMPGDGLNPWAQAKANVEAGVALPKVFLSVGLDDGAKEMVFGCRDYLQELGYDVFYEGVPGLAHEWDFWDQCLRKAVNEWLPLRREPILPE